MPASQDSSAPPFESRFPELSLPEGGWTVNIPQYVLDGCDDQMKWLLTEMSKNTQATNFACQASIDMSKHLRALNGKVFKNESAVHAIREDLEAVKTQTKAVTPLIKPMAQFAALWEIRVFRWPFYAAIFFFFTYLLPYYLQHPISLTNIFERLLAP